MFLNKTFAIFSLILCHVILIRGQSDDDNYNIGINFYKVNVDSSIYYFEKCAEPYRKKENWEKYVNCFNALASCHALKGNYTSSYTYAMTAIEAAQKHLNDSSKEAFGSALHNLASFTQTSGDFNRSIELYKKSIELDIKHKNDESQIVTLNKIGLCYFKSGDFIESKKYYTRSLDLAEKVLSPTNTNRIRALIGIANLYKEEIKIDTALQIYNRALLLGKGNNSKEKAIPAYVILEIYHRKAEILLNSNSKEKFHQNLSELNSYYKKTFNRNSIKALLLSGNWNAKSKNYNKALKNFLTALRLEKESNKNIRYSTTLGEIYTNIGKVFLEKKDYKSALSNFDTALIHFQIDPNISAISSSLKNAVLNISTLELLRIKANTHFKIYEELKRPVELSNSEYWYFNGIELINKVRQSYLNRGSKENLLNKSSNIFEGMLSVLKILYDENPSDELIAQIYEVYENSKAIILLESINENNALGAAGIPDTLIQKELDLKRNINYHKAQLHKFSANDSSKIKIVNANLFNLEKEHTELIDLFETGYPKYYDLKYNDNFNTLDDGKLLVSQNNSALLNYFVGENHIYILALTNKEVKFERVDKPDNFNSQIEELRHIISNPPDSKRAQIEFEVFQKSANDLYNLLISPLDLPSNINHLKIIPDDVLAYIPFEILLSKSYESGSVNYKLAALDYLVEDYEITYLYSTSLTNQKMNHNDIQDKDIISFAPSFSKQDHQDTDRSNCTLESLTELSCNTFEAERIAELFEGESLSGSVANKANFTAKIEDYRIAHIATHSCLNDDNPMLNRIFFSDDYISNYDLYNLNLNNEMVVLSACNTGSGALRRGEGVMSLSRGFIHAGCPSVLMSLWSVEDCTTTDIMVNFYKEIKDGRSKDKALQSAKLNYLHQANKLESHPFYWAPFVHIGNAEPIYFSTSYDFWIWGILIIALLIGIFVFKKPTKST